MVAAAFTGTLVLQGQTGKRISYPITASDVAAANYIFPDGNGDVVLPTNLGGYLTVVDLILSAAGTDTRTADIYVNGKVTGEAVQNNANLYNGQYRQFMSAPVNIAAGARVRFIQRA